MVLAAGLATRLRPVTDDVAKPALDFCGRTMLDRVLDGLAAAGVTHAVVNLHHAPDSVRAVVAARGAALPAVTWSDETAELLGTGGALVPVRATFADDHFLLVNGDCVHAVDCAALMAEHRASGASATLAVRPHGERGFGALRVGQSGEVVAFSVPATGAGDERHFLSVQAVSPSLLDELPALPRAFSSFTAWYPPARERGHVFRVHETLAEWHALDSRELFLGAVRDWLARRGGAPFVAPNARVAPGADVDGASSLSAGVMVGAGARIEGSAILDGARIGAGARVVRSLVGPGATVGDGAVVEDRIVARGGTSG